MVTRTRAGSDDRKRLDALHKKLQRAKTEEDVKGAWTKCLDLDYDTADDIDLYTPQVIFEFKYSADLLNVQHAAPVIAQTLYYLRRLKRGLGRKAIPGAFALIDRTSVVIGQVGDWRDIFTDAEERFDWDLRPSSPDPRLVATVLGHPAIRAVRAFSMESTEQSAAALRALDQYFGAQATFDFGDKKIITEGNFEDVFTYWNEVFGESVRNGFKSSRYFVNDIQDGRTQVVASEGKVYFQVGPEEVRIKRILADDYFRFWSLYEKVTDPETTRGILAKIDRLTEEVERRKHGEFFTPLPFARKALEYIEHELGHRWWERGDVRVWDMAAGTGNLEYHLPAQAWPTVYLSTLYGEDVEHCQRLFPGSTVFQYDYLNDDIGNLFTGDDGRPQPGFDFNNGRTWKLPAQLRADLSNPNLRWVILINPPFATAQQGGAGGANKADVSKTLVRSQMHNEDLGEVSRELFSQFLYRIRREFAGRQAYLGLFSKIKYMNATNDQKLRDSVFRFGFRRGFIFSSVNFSGTSRTGQFPVGFLLWHLSTDQALEDQDVTVDVFDTKVQKTGIKRITSEHRDGFLSKWVERPAGIAKFPPFSSAITVKTNGPDLRDRICHGFLGSLMCAGNDLQHQNMTALLSGPYASAGGHSITENNFEKALVVHAVRRLPKAEWHNDRDPFLQPTDDLSDEFVRDCVIWSLFSNSNATVAMRDVTYQEKSWQIPNHFFPILLAELRDWSMTDRDISNQLPTAEDRFVAKWIDTHTFSPEAENLYKAGIAVYKLFFEHMNTLRISKFKIESWDAGWWQIRSAIEDRQIGSDELRACKEAADALKSKLLPQIFEYGFLA
ncbi:hypothetical protein [uncultured Rhodoferax sp.]|uniref:hypothetical protein n=1 Tax=uncultured Rhodoferax sp. TaxID=223188 RepID=UPI0025DEA9D2|nr:hypothetical protein [uncultured Rhodoferax sp.]